MKGAAVVERRLVGMVTTGGVGARVETFVDGEDVVAFAGVGRVGEATEVVEVEEEEEEKGASSERRFPHERPSQL